MKQLINSLSLNMISLKSKMIMTMIIRMKNFTKGLMQFLQGFHIWVGMINNKRTKIRKTNQSKRNLEKIILKRAFNKMRPFTAKPN